MTLSLTRRGRGLGCVTGDRDDDRHIRYPAGVLIGAGSPGPRASMADLVFVPPGYSFADQQSKQECVGWYLTQCVHIRMRAMGLAPITPSPSGVYYQALCRANGGPDGIWDGGCNPHDAWESQRETGIVTYDRHPHTMSLDAPDPGDYRVAADHDWLRYRWVLSSGQARVNEVVALLASRRPVGFACDVDQALEDWVPGHAPWQRVSKSLGGHAMTMVGYDTLSSGSRVFIVANSWGDVHDHGFFLMSESQLAGGECRYIVTPDINPASVPR